MDGGVYNKDFGKRKRKIKPDTLPLETYDPCVGRGTCTEADVEALLRANWTSEGRVSPGAKGDRDE